MKYFEWLQRKSGALSHLCQRCDFHRFKFVVQRSLPLLKLWQHPARARLDGRAKDVLSELADFGNP